MLLDVSVVNPHKVMYEGQARSVILPGEEGVFEVLPLHHRIVSRLVTGTVFIDDKGFAVKRGIAGVDLNKVTIIVETA